MELTPKRGRPPLYDESIHPDALVEMMSKGMLDCEIYAEWGITRETFCKWKREHEEFKEAHEEGMPKCEAVYVRKMRECWLSGDDKGFKYCIALMNNKFGWGKDESKGSTTNNIQIGNMNVLQAKSNTELLEILQQKLKTLSQYQDVKILDVKPEQSE